MKSRAEVKLIAIFVLLEESSQKLLLNLRVYQLKTINSPMQRVFKKMRKVIENTQTPESANKLNKHGFVKSQIRKKRERVLAKLTLKNIYKNSFRNHPYV